MIPLLASIRLNFAPSGNPEQKYTIGFLWAYAYPASQIVPISLSLVLTKRKSAVSIWWRFPEKVASCTDLGASGGQTNILLGEAKSKKFDLLSKISSSRSNSDACVGLNHPLAK